MYPAIIKQNIKILRVENVKACIKTNHTQYMPINVIVKRTTE